MTMSFNSHKFSTVSYKGVPYKITACTAIILVAPDGDGREQGDHPVARARATADRLIDGCGVVATSTAA